MIKKQTINKKGFTLIELLAVIVILGVLMLIAIPAVTRYIDSSRKNAYISTLNSAVDTVRYGVVSGYGNYSMENSNEKDFTFDNIETEKGTIQDIGGITGYIKVIKSSNGYDYEIYVTGNVSGNNNPEYCLDAVKPEDLSANSLTACYSEDSVYSVGDTITYKGSTWRVIKDSKSQDYVTLLKDNILVNNENETNANNVEVPRENVIGTNVNKSNYVVFYWSSTCHGAATIGGTTYSSASASGCSGHNVYTGSTVEAAVNRYVDKFLDESDLKAVSLDGKKYKARLITTNELINDLGWTSGLKTSPKTTGNTVPDWVYPTGKSYWTMTTSTDPSRTTPSYVWTVVNNSGDEATMTMSDLVIYGGTRGVRPVINLLKSKIPAQS